MKLLIVSGLSGAGKTVALHSLEDLGAYCIDNLPVQWLPSLAQHASEWDHSQHTCLAIGVDARNLGGNGDQGMEARAMLDAIRTTEIPYEILYLEASDEVLIHRFSETRRKHPLARLDCPLREAIARDRKLLEPVAELADLRIDTSHLHIHQLHERIRVQVNLAAHGKLTLFFQSFGFKHGLPQEADFVFDVRCLPNPYWELELRAQTGKDAAVAQFLGNQPSVHDMIKQILDFLDSWVPRFEADHRRYLTVAFGCTGGRHRSVFVAEQVAARFRAHYDTVSLHHRELV